MLRRSNPELMQDMASPTRQVGGPWFAIQVNQRREEVVSSILANKGFIQFLPQRKVVREWCDRVVEREIPLFPGYLFCRLDLSTRLLPVLTTPGVVRIVGLGRTPVPVPESEISAIQAIVNSGLAAEPWPIPQVGDRVRIRLGPLRGLEGILIGTKKRRRFVVSVTLLNRAVAVEVDAECTCSVH